MKPERNPDEKFEWDMTAIILLVLLIVLILVLAVAFGPLRHSGR